MTGDCFRWWGIVSDYGRLFPMMGDVSDDGGLFPIMGDCFRWWEIVSDDRRLFPMMGVVSDDGRLFPMIGDCFRWSAIVIDNRCWSLGFLETRRWFALFYRSSVFICFGACLNSTPIIGGKQSVGFHNPNSSQFIGKLHVSAIIGDEMRQIKTRL